MKSIKWKLVVIYLAVVFIVMIVSGTFIIMRIENVDMETKRSELRTSVKRIKEEVINKYDIDDFQKQLGNQYNGKINSPSEIYVNILDKNGAIIATSATSSSYTLPPESQYAKNSDVISALSGKASFSTEKDISYVIGTLVEMMNYAVPIFDDNGTDVKYVVFVRMNINTVRDNQIKIAQIIVIAVLLALALGGIMGYIFANTLTVPIIELTKGTKEIAEGNLNKRLSVHSDDEIGQLTENFNYMANELNKIMYVTSSEKNKLEAVLHNMTDGVLAYDKDGYLIHANPASNDMLELDEIPINIFALIEKFSLNATMDDFLSIEEGLTFEQIIDVNEKYIKLNIVPYFSEEPKADGIIVVLQDITKQKKLDDMRKEFVANVSHELRTPLTTVKSYAETLLDGAMEEPEIAKEFLEIIDSEADRMALLVTDLLQLSRFDTKQFELKLSPIMINEFLTNCWQQHKILAEKKNHTYIYEPAEENLELNIDADRVSQVLSNVITNAIKYSPENSTITIYTQNTDKYFKIIVKDNGLGIPKEDIPRIFERFYRVDKARSRAMGGTGLGLAISKEIMELHKGSIAVESEYGKGTIMTLSLPKELNL